MINVMAKKNSLYLLCCAILFIFSISFAATSSTTQVGRYLTAASGATMSQEDPLQTVFQLTFPETVVTVGDAMQYLLVHSGYSIVPVANQSSAIRDLLKQPLPLSNRTMGLMTVEQGLLALSGNAYQLLVDPQHRLVSYQLKSRYQTIYDDNDE